MKANTVSLLIVDDEPQIRRMLRTSLLAQKFNVAEAGTAAAALKRLETESFDLVILDLGLPDSSGFAVLETIRKNSKIPIIVLSVRSDEAGKVKALELGADDYVTKPFGMAELVMRIRVALRHRYQEQGAEPLLVCGDVTINLVLRQVTLNGQEVRLTPTEYDLLGLLAEHAGRILTHDYILRRVWGEDKADDVQSLRVYIRALRQKLGDTGLIRTETGVGYRLVPGDAVL